MTEYQTWEKRQQDMKKSVRVLLLFTLACITAVVFVMWVFDTDEPTQEQIEQFHQERDERISR